MGTSFGSGTAGIQINEGDLKGSCYRLNRRLELMDQASSSLQTQVSKVNTSLSELSTASNPLNPEPSNWVYAGPKSGLAAPPSFRQLVADDVPIFASTRLSDSSTLVRGGAALVDVGAIPMVASADTLGESAITDNGTTVAIAGRNVVIGQKISSYNGTATAGIGAVTTYAVVSITQTSSGIPQTLRMGGGVATVGRYLVSLNISASGTPGASFSYTLTYTDRTGAVTITLPLIIPAGGSLHSDPVYSVYSTGTADIVLTVTTTSGVPTWYVDGSLLKIS